MTVEIVEASSLAELEEVLMGRGKAVIDFWAPWCKPCEDVERELRELAEGYECGDLVIVRVDASKASDALVKYRVLGLPTVIAVVSGRQASRRVGPVTAEELAGILGCRPRG